MQAQLNARQPHVALIPGMQAQLNGLQVQMTGVQAQLANIQALLLALNPAGLATTAALALRAVEAARAQPPRPQGRAASPRAAHGRQPAPFLAPRRLFPRRPD